jgi:hypothetical protein
MHASPAITKMPAPMIDPQRGELENAQGALHAVLAGLAGFGQPKNLLATDEHE